MRDRLVAAFVTLTVAVVAVFLVERAYTTSGLIEAEERRDVVRAAEIVAALVADRRSAPSAEQLGAALPPGDRIEYVDRSGARVIAGGPGVAGTPEPSRAPGAGVTATAGVPGGGQVTYTREARVVQARIADELLPFVLIVLVLVGAAALAAVGLARRLSRPFTELASTAGRLGRGDLDVQVGAYRVPEADAVARALRSSAREMGELVRRERTLAANASHDLRTPVTALRLELEELALSPTTPPDAVPGVSRALDHVDRLCTSIAQLLDSSRAARDEAAVEIDLAAVVRGTPERWGGATLGRRLLVDTGPEGPVAARVPAAALIEVLDALVSNALRHGGGDVAVAVQSCGEYAEVSVVDEGHSARTAPVVPQQHGLEGGLANARLVAQSFGGRLRLEEAAGAPFTLTIPLSRPTGRQPSHAASRLG